MPRSCSGRPASVSTARTANTNARPTEPHASHAVPRLPRRSPINRFSATAASGSAGMIQSIVLGLALEEVDLVHVHRLLETEHVDDDGETDRDLGSRDSHDEEHEDLAVERVHRARERDEREIRGVQHELDRHEDDERVAAHEHPDDADHEYD